MRSAKGGKEVVQSHDVGQVRDLHRCLEASRALGMQQIIRADPDAEHMPRLHAVGVVVVVLLARNSIVAALGKGYQLRGDRPAALRATHSPENE